MFGLGLPDEALKKIHYQNALPFVGMPSRNRSRSRGDRGLGRPAGARPPHPTTPRKTKPSPEDLPGKREQRVFVGGQYDFMPTLRIIAQFIHEVSSSEKFLFPIIPLDYEIGVEETMDRDIEILGRCAHAIFDLSDLGAQLVEMQEARQKRIRALVVYPVRELVNQPERGRRTVLSFGLPHFGYRTFSELKGIVWRFLMDVPTERDYPPRFMPDPVLDREIRRSRLLWGRGDAEEAAQVLRDLVRGMPFRRETQF